MPRQRRARAGWRSACCRRCAAGGVWFGWSGETRDAPNAEPEIAEKDGIRFVTIDLPTAHFDAVLQRLLQRRRSGRCITIFPVPSATMPASSKPTWRSIGLRRCAGIKQLQEGDVIWVHDYHLIPLGSLLRQPACKRGSASSCTFPIRISRCLRLLPVYAELVRDMCQYDLVGFQTERGSGRVSDRRSRPYFAMRPAIRERAHRAQRPRDRHGRIPNRRRRRGDFTRCKPRRRATTNRSSDSIEGLLGRKLILGVDRLDYSKGLVERFASYRALARVESGTARARSPISRSHR